MEETIPDFLANYPCLTDIYLKIPSDRRILCEMKNTIGTINTDNYVSVIDTIYEQYQTINERDIVSDIAEEIRLFLQVLIDGIKGSFRDIDEIYTYFKNKFSISGDELDDLDELEEFQIERFVANQLMMDDSDIAFSYDCIYENITYLVFKAIFNDDVENMLSTLSDPLSHHLTTYSYSIFIMATMFYGSVKCFKALISMNNYDEDAIDSTVAVFGNNYEIIHILENKYPEDLVHVLPYAASWCRWELTEYLLKIVDESYIDTTFMIISMTV